MKNKRHKKYSKFIYFDTETVYQYSTPIEDTVISSEINGKEIKKIYKRLNVIAYAVGWCYADFFWRLDLIKNIDKPLQVDLKKCPTFIKFGKYAVDEFVRYLDHESIKYDLTVFVHNAAFDIPFLSAARDRRFKDCIEIEEKHGHKKCIVCKWRIKRPGYKTQNIEFKDTNLFENNSLKNSIKNFLDENGKKMTKDQIEYEKIDMEFNEDGSPKCYYILKRLKIGVNKKGEIIDVKQKIKVNWEDVEKDEHTYLLNDIKGLPLLEIQQMRLKETAYSVVKDKCNLTSMSPPEKRRLLNSLTKGTLGKMLCSWIQRHEYSDDELISEWASSHKGNYFNALLKHRYKDKKDYDMDLRSMFGGFTSFGSVDTWNAEEGEFGYVVDVNSLYPWIMTQGLPVGEVLNCPPPGLEGIDYVKQYVFRPRYRSHINKRNKKMFKGILPTWKPQYPFRTNVLGNSFFSKYKYLDDQVLRDDEFTIWSFYQDEIISKMCDYKFEFSRCRYQRLLNPLNKYMHAMQEIKQENSDFIEGKGSLKEMKYQASKVLSNAMYGKSMEKRHEDTLIYNQKLGVYMGVEEYKFYGGQVYEEPYFTGNTGSYICSYARLTLMKAMKAIIDKGGKVFYCDTDSIMFTLKGELPSEIPIHSKELGKFKVERIFNAFRGNGKCKKYHVSLRGINLKDDEVIPWIKNNHPKWVWQHLENKPVENWKHLLSPKFASSGFDKELIKQLPLSLIDILYSPNENIKIFDARNAAVRDMLTRVTLIKKLDSNFNVESVNEDHFGNKVVRGVAKDTGVLIPIDIKGKRKWILKRINELPLIDEDNQETWPDIENFEWYGGV